MPDERLELYAGDCREVMAGMSESSIDAIVTDPPYELGFMGKGWDRAGIANSVEMWRAALRVLKPGGHLLAFGAPRTYHRMTCAIEDAGFEIRDCLQWLFGSGFPKSLDVSKAIDKAAGAEREITRDGTVKRDGYGKTDGNARRWDNGGSETRPRHDAPVTDLAREWEGWGTALKPAYEPIVLARKPLMGTVAANVTAHGVGGLNIDGSRIGDADLSREYARSDFAAMGYGGAAEDHSVVNPAKVGRWPANVLLDAEAARLLDAMSGESLSAGGGLRNGDKYGGGYEPVGEDVIGLGDRGGASRFFYTAKASRSEREFGLNDLDPSRRVDSDSRSAEAPGSNNPRLRVSERRNDHPTVKPIDLMRWLCRLVTPPNGVILDPFVGSGSTGMAALDEGFRFIGCDLDAHYLLIARERIEQRHLLAALPERVIAADNGQGRLI